ncbi:hypothetical protein SAMN05444678_102237 [Sphingomonas sp. YR710]|nr:hypothetical protein SAMN05444678_102237 [Sphingomonas sp. YR710]
MEVTADRGIVALRVPIDGRLRTVRMDGATALALANKLASVAVTMEGGADRIVDGISEILLRPGTNGGADMLVVSEQVGPMGFRLPANLLLALSEAANGVLELRKDTGTA